MHEDRQMLLPDVREQHRDSQRPEAGIQTGGPAMNGMKDKKCGCIWLSYPDNEDGPAESFWDLCPMHQEQADRMCERKYAQMLELDEVRK